MALRRLPGPKQRKRTKKDSRDRVARRNAEQVSARLTVVLQLLIGDGIFGKYPAFRVRDILTICLFCQAMSKISWNLDGIALLFIAAHSIRCPKLWASQVKLARKGITYPWLAMGSAIFN